ncbi:MAG: hypothetical protein HY903_09360 [Deltaproteobacteria bacterium]|nr:hypothetical protein [Deltaproteobacteria bacterium]
MARRRTRGEVAIEGHLQTLDPTSDRYRILTAARDFKAAWVELGERLTEVRERERFLAWGYSSFEGYCRRELHIKAETAMKLTRSYSFLRDHEPGALKERQKRELPPLDVVDLLSQARERATISDADLTNVRQEVFSGELNPTKTQVVRRLREIDPEAFKPALRPTKAGDGDTEVRKALLLAERLQVVMEGLSGVSRDASTAVKRVVAELKHRFETAREAKSA